MQHVFEPSREKSIAIVDELRHRLNELAAQRQDRIREKRGKQWIAWRSANRDRVFAEVRASRNRVEVFILPGRRELRDPSGLAQRAPPSQGWGWFQSRFHVTQLGQVAPAFRLLKQSYEAAGRRTNSGNGHRRNGRSGQTV